jgi:hypothetical protein
MLPTLASLSAGDGATIGDLFEESRSICGSYITLFENLSNLKTNNCFEPLVSIFGYPNRITIEFSELKEKLADGESDIQGQ